MHGFLSRLLLSLLMVWQLLASVVAHPLAIPAAVNGAVADQQVAESSESEHCVHATQPVHDDLQPAQHTAPAGHGGCGAKCHCPCAGTPALSMTLPLTTFTAADGLPVAALQISLHSLPVVNPLRPPILS